ncbi:uncharacterized protein LOC135809094 [Sycon ciliatum]|uniref:uncharacterized protein LOC135809094 n=1 Tax=Sycon ciliatum TaxID=27933 RepID=UPI0031F6D08C
MYTREKVGGVRNAHRMKDEISWAGSVAEDLARLASLCLQVQPERRPVMEEVLDCVDEVKAIAAGHKPKNSILARLIQASQQKVPRAARPNAFDEEEEAKSTTVSKPVEDRNEHGNLVLPSRTRPGKQQAAHGQHDNQPQQPQAQAQKPNQHQQMRQAQPMPKPRQAAQPVADDAVPQEAADAPNRPGPQYQQQHQHANPPHQQHALVQPQQKQQLQQQPQQPPQSPHFQQQGHPHHDNQQMPQQPHQQQQQQLAAQTLSDEHRSRLPKSIDDGIDADDDTREPNKRPQQPQQATQDDDCQPLSLNNKPSASFGDALSDSLNNSRHPIGVQRMGAIPASRPSDHAQALSRMTAGECFPSIESSTAATGSAAAGGLHESDINPQALIRPSVAPIGAAASPLAQRRFGERSGGPEGNLVANTQQPENHATPDAIGPGRKFREELKTHDLYRVGDEDESLLLSTESDSTPSVIRSDDLPIPHQVSESCSEDTMSSTPLVTGGSSYDRLVDSRPGANIRRSDATQHGDYSAGVLEPPHHQHHRHNPHHQRQPVAAGYNSQHAESSAATPSVVGSLYSVGPFSDPINQLTPRLPMMQPRSQLPPQPQANCSHGHNHGRNSTSTSSISSTNSTSNLRYHKEQSSISLLSQSVRVKVVRMTSTINRCSSKCHRTPNLIQCVIIDSFDSQADSVV